MKAPRSSTICYGTGPLQSPQHLRRIKRALVTLGIFLLLTAFKEGAVITIHRQRGWNTGCAAGQAAKRYPLGRPRRAWK